MVYTVNCDRVVITKDVERGSVWRGVVIALIASLGFFTHGIQTANLTSTAHSGHFINTDHVPWSTTALVITAAIAGPVFCYTIDRHGRKMGIFIINLVQGASLIPLFFLNDTSTIILHVIAGMATGGLFTVCPIYIQEISSLKTKGFSMCVTMVMTAAGYMMRLVMNLEERMFFMVALVMFQFILMVFVLESPSYLVMKRKFETASALIAKLRGLDEDNPNVMKELKDLREESDRARANGRITIRMIYRNKIWWDSIKIGLVLYTTMILCGSIVFLNQSKALIQLKGYDDPQSVLVTSALLAGSLLTLICVTILDMKYLLSLGYAIMALASGVLAVYNQVDLEVTSYQWLAIASLATLLFGYGMSWVLPIIVLTQTLNFEIKATLLGMLFAYFQLIKLAHAYTFPYIEEYVGAYTLFYIFASVNLYGAVYNLFVSPNVNGLNVRQIEKQIKRIPLPA
ncbi:uncharacterized protein LOC114242520 [Bombyx mandarina]|uniref:Uncharacterized protein LOC114242520 n=1 Tax=Bombyx mandarina TaxID=7092 RepID=A0A6J2JKF5_BOMMA|nr:uncharacterized protein LOC114242520 [Bombyx mandarina]